MTGDRAIRLSAWTWTSVKCPECGAEIGEDCFRSDRVWGKLPIDEGTNRYHQARISAILRHPDNPGRKR
jgi:hypothetical protein